MSRGGTILEVLVALVLLGVVLLGLTAGVTLMTRAWRAAVAHALVADRGRARMEELLATSGAARVERGQEIVRAGGDLELAWWEEDGPDGRRLLVAAHYRGPGVRTGDTLTALRAAAGP